MLEDLIQAKKISPREHKLFLLFSSELGREVLSNMVEETFMEEPLEKEFTGTRFAFYDGRRSLIRSIKVNVEKVQTLIKEQLNDNRSNQQ